MEEKVQEPVVHHTHEADVFRTRVFGIQDGLIGVGSIVLGSAGFSQDPLLVIVAGLIATIAQAFSMGVGEYISTRVRDQILKNELRKEMYEIENFPEKEKQELKDFYMRKGINEDLAEQLAELLMKNKEVALQEMLTHELKIFPEEFESPVKLGFVMALYLVIGGLIPLAPFMLGRLLPTIPFDVQVLASVALVEFTLALFGVMATKYTGLSKVRGALEQIGTGTIALLGGYLGGMLLSHVIPVSGPIL